MLRLHPEPQHSVMLRDANTECAPGRVAPVAAVEDDAVMRGAASPAVHCDLGSHAVRVPADNLEAMATVRAAGDLARFVPHAARLRVVAGVAARRPAPARGPAVGVALAVWRVSFKIGDVQCGDRTQTRRHGNRWQAVLRAVVEDQVGESFGRRIGRCGTRGERQTAHRQQPHNAVRGPAVLRK